nr:helix-turn-helix domain-containing protein [Jiangella mangrovi]
MTPSPDREPLVDVAVVAEHLDVSPKWIERNAERLGLPRRKIGGRWRFRMSEVDSWVNNQGALSDQDGGQ